MAEQYLVNHSDLASVADAIRTKAGMSAELTFPSGFVSAVEGIQTGGVEIINDGKMRIYITLSEGRTSPMVGVCPNGTVEVDWGDGTTPDVLTGTDTSVVQYTPKHEYVEPGDYVITLDVDGEIGLSGIEYVPYLLRNSTTDSDKVSEVYRKAVTNVQLSESVTVIGLSALDNISSQNDIIIPDGIIDIGDNAFRGTSTQRIVIPNSVRSIGYSSFTNCSYLRNIVIPDNVTSIGMGAFNGCHSFTHLAIPPGVKTINAYTFYGCRGMKVYDFTRHTAVPTLDDTNAFNNIAADCEIRVPSSLLSTWKAATNWSKYASNIVAG